MHRCSNAAGIFATGCHGADREGRHLLNQDREFEQVSSLPTAAADPEVFAAIRDLVQEIV